VRTRQEESNQGGGENQSTDGEGKSQRPWTASDRVGASRHEIAIRRGSSLTSTPSGGNRGAAVSQRLEGKGIVGKGAEANGRAALRVDLVIHGRSPSLLSEQ
jgi:hypothetical protein